MNCLLRSNMKKEKYYYGEVWCMDIKLGCNMHAYWLSSKDTGNLVKCFIHKDETYEFIKKKDLKFVNTRAKLEESKFFSKQEEHKLNTIKCEEDKSNTIECEENTESTESTESECEEDKSNTIECEENTESTESEEDKSNTIECEENTESTESEEDDLKVNLVNIKEDKYNSVMRVQEQKDRIAEEKAINAEKGMPGLLACTKWYKNDFHRVGFYPVFMNRSNRKLGKCIAALSPFCLGPVNSGQEGLPNALNLQNFWEFSKIYEGQTMEEFRELQKEKFLDPIPRKHNRKGVVPKGWMFSVEEPYSYNQYFLDDMTYSEVESRQFFCTFYEMVVKNTEEWKELSKAVKEGLNINIVGRDCVDSVNLKYLELERLYLDPSKPFGYELVLVCILTLKQMPWVRNRTVSF